MTAPVLVADFAIDGERVSPAELVDAAAERGASFVAADVGEDDDEKPVAEVDGQRIGGLARLAALALRRQVGLFLRLHGTLPIAGLAEALSVARDASASPGLRERFLLVVDGERVGRRLRAEAPQFPSAFELTASGGGLLGRWLPLNLRRASADVDDLVVPWGRLDPARLASRIAPDLARRGARLWISDVPETDLDRARSLPAAGVVVRWPLRRGAPAA